MFIRNNLCKIVWNASLKLAVLGMLFLMNSFSLRAQASDVLCVECNGDVFECRFFFPFDNAEFQASYLDNSKTVATLDSLIGIYGAAKVQSLKVIAYSSPEGSYQYNVNLSARRAESLRNFIIAKYPSLSGKITLSPGDESWDTLRAMIEYDIRLGQTSRSKMLAIIDSNDAPDVKERKLSEMPIYKYLYANYFKKLRYAAVRMMIFGDGVTGTEAAVPGTTGTTGAQAATGSQAASTATAASATTAAAASAEPAVYFKKSETGIEPEYMGNAATLDGLRSLLEEAANGDASNIEKITIVGHSSPDGPTALNKRLSAKRAKALAETIEKEYPELKGRIKIESAGEDWDGLRELVEAAESFSDEARERLLVIINSNDSPAKKKAALKAQPEFDILAESILPKLRRSEYSIEYKPAEPSIVPEIEFDEEIPDEPLYAYDESEGTYIPLDTTTPTWEYRRLPLFAASTNLLYDLAITPNFALEIPIGKEWSIYGEYAFPWWVNQANDRAWQILKWDLGVRHWFSRHSVSDPMDILNGHFAALEFSSGYYDIEPKHSGNQGEFQSFSFQYGYAWKLAKAWRLDAHIGAGWLGTHYRHYEGDATDAHLVYQYNGRTQWFGPTDAGVSVKYIFTRTPGRRIAK